MVAHAGRLEELGVTVLVLYLLPAGLDKLRPFMEQWLNSDRKGLGEACSRRIVTITYSVPGWECNNAQQFNKSWLFQYT